MIKQQHIVTSYFANAKELRASGYTIVSISRYNPRFLTGVISYKQVAPSAYLLGHYRKYKDINHYLSIYKHMLLNMDEKQVAEDLWNLTNGRPIALCCYERPDDFCHRHLVAAWLNTKLGLNIKEF